MKTRQSYISPPQNVMNRRQALTLATIPLVGAAGCMLDSNGSNHDKVQPPALKIGLLSDVHYAEKLPDRGRYFSDSYEKLGECIGYFNTVKPDFIIQLGDIYNDKRSKYTDIETLNRINALYHDFSGDCYHVVGNHDVTSITREEYLDLVGLESGYYSFDQNGFHCVVLDANYKKDGGQYNDYYEYAKEYDQTYILTEQREWLAHDLADHADMPAIVFIHQCLDLPPTELRAVKNAGDVRQTLETAGNVRFVFQGHEHQGNYSYINGIHYVTLRGMVEGPGIENNSYGFGDIGVQTGSVEGFSMQPDYVLDARSAARTG